MTEKELSAEHKGLKFHGDGWEPITRWRDNGYGRSLDDKAISDLEMRVDAAIREAEAQGASREREECAKIAYEAWKSEVTPARAGVAGNIYEAIRARGTAK